MDKQRVAILVIHGIGEQDPYETLDRFTRSLVDCLLETNKDGIKLTHHHKPCQDVRNDFIRLNALDDKQTEIDIHEYYWAHTMQRIISFREVLLWLKGASQGAEQFYEENVALAKQLEGPFADGKFKPHWYMTQVGGLMRFFARTGLISRLFMPGWMDPVFRLLMPRAAQTVADYVGDVAVYTTTEVKSPYYEIRRRVQGGAVQKVRMLLEEGYDKIIIAGHSLGSVIAYDALSEINLLMNTDARLRARRGQLFELVTFGSPLDKVAFFFRDHLQSHDYVRLLILNSLTGFRRRGLVVPEMGAAVHGSSTVVNYLKDLNWYNYWDEKDPVSGRLDFYEGVENRQIDNGLDWGVAHVGYWQNKEMFRETVLRVQKAISNRTGRHDVRGDYDIEFLA